MSTKDKIKEILEKKFIIHHLEIIDDSAKHAGHAEAQKSGGGHFSILIVSDDFKGKSLTHRHRLIYTALKQENIHALAIKTMTVSENKNS